MQASRDIERLLEIMAALRDPATGCPWDAEQDFASIAPYTVEEAYEVTDAIARKDMADLRDELGDLLLQVVFHARMAEEADLFDFGGVVEAITTKMIRRHPHVFGSAEAREAGMAKDNWERIKAEERELKKRERQANGDAERPQGYLDDVPLGHPALTRALKLQQRAAKVGFDWKEEGPVLDKIEEELGELREAMEARNADEVRAEFGDLLFALVNLGRHIGVDAETALRGTNDKFRHRFHHVERRLNEEGSSLAAASLDEMEAHWQDAKKR